MLPTLTGGVHEGLAHAGHQNPNLLNLTIPIAIRACLGIMTIVL